jgi:hypothetical protein
MPDPAKLVATIRKAVDLILATPGRSGNVITLDDAEDVLVVGDLHGNLRSFKAMLDRAEMGLHPRRHLVLQELVHDIGADPAEGRPDLSHRLVDVVCALKCQYSDRVHVILGNHELSEVTNRPIAKNGLPLNRSFREGVQRTYGRGADAIHAAYMDLFRALPLALRTPNRVFVVHTLPEAQDLESFDLGVLSATGWTDEQSRRRGSVYALTWGRDNDPETADRFAALVDADFFVCGHQPCDEGFRVANHRMLILDGTDPYPASCLFPATRSVAFEDLVAGVRVALRI